jgi:hypothetical protein
LGDQLSGKDEDDSDESEVDDEGVDMDDQVGHLFDLAEAAHLVDVYHTDEDIPLLENITLHERSIPSRKRTHL